MLETGLLSRAPYNLQKIKLAPSQVFFGISGQTKHTHFHSVRVHHVMFHTPKAPDNILQHLVE